ncbi:conserved hypothetical alanine-rich protein [Amycolatopsis camponoti]|uniref:Conserved hypothetical alanine-rich protein n=1 Tax=Amycolatopsis camponoti TaxID=2606593 RepID=A0A6I8LXM3_9PSEU|nr:hypothetical protein [Amycolatopsis camponoti]VVJ21303.1 conserved hypothetical alanine-rich protein [Amycolatopsis camponoti]
MKVTGYAYPWDVLESGFAARVRDLGVDEVAVALSYHSARAATPWSASRTAVVARHAAFYRPVSEGWGALRPSTPDWVTSEDSGGDAVRLLTEAGIPAAAWIVLTHNSQLGYEHPDVVVRNCFGESYPWALCPSQPAVREYAATLTAEAVAGLELSSVILEACGPLGAVHQHQHEKTDGVWAPAVARLLSICCCDACASSWDLDADTVRAQLVEEVRRLVATGDLGVTADDLPPDLTQALLRTRQRATDELRAAVLDRLPAGTRVVLHGALDPWVTGALPGLTPSAADDADAVVLFGWAPATGADAVAAAREALPERVAIGSYITAVAAAPVPDIAAYVGELAKAGAAELHLYHLGLAGPGRWGDLGTATAAAHEN